MIFLTIGQVALGLTMSLSYGNNRGSVTSSWLEDHLQVTNNTITLNDFDYNSALQSANLPTINTFGNYLDEQFNLYFNCQYYDNGRLLYDFRIDGLKFGVQSDEGGDFEIYFGSQVDNDTLTDTFNLMVNYNVWVGTSTYKTHFNFTNTQMMLLTQYDTTFVPYTYCPFVTRVNFTTIDIISIDEALARVIGEGYYGSDDFNTGYNQGHREGYEEGYHDGLTASDTEAYETGHAEGYAEGLADGMETGHITEIFSNIVQVGILPINVFLAMLNFEVFGINIGSFASGLLTIAIVIIIVRLVTGSSASGGGGKNDN